MPAGQSPQPDVQSVDIDIPIRLDNDCTNPVVMNMVMIVVVCRVSVVGWDARLRRPSTEVEHCLDIYLCVLRAENLSQGIESPQARFSTLQGLSRQSVHFIED